MEFDAMTVRQIAEYIEAAGAKEVKKFKEKAILLQGMAQQIASVLPVSRKAKFLGLDKLYPKIFGNKKTVDTSHMTPEQIQRMSVNMWREFLGA